MTRECELCGSEIIKRPRDSKSEWESRIYCSQTCSNRSHVADPIHLRFWRMVRKSEQGCWLWEGSKDGRGYGTLSSIREGAPLKAHRVSWEMRNGPIPAGLVVCHKCDTPACVNPAHLFLGTQKDNMQDMSSKGRINKNSFGNLRPGQKGFHGAGSLSNREKALGSRNQ